jgi:hypothetical protein
MSWLAGAMFWTFGVVAQVADAPDAGPERPAYYERLVVESDLAGRSLDDLSLMRNTIYARTGHRFKNPKLREYFTRQIWYQSGTPSKLSGVDLANLRVIAARERALLSQPLTFACPEAHVDGTPVDRRTEAALLALGRKFHWDDVYGFPDCHRRVQLQCGPDLDGDGRPESIVRIEGDVLVDHASCKTNMYNGNDFWPVAKTFIISGRLDGWRTVQKLGSEIQGAQQGESTTARFVRRRDAGYAIEWYTERDTGEGGCRAKERTIYRVVQRKLHVIEVVQDQRPCDEQ